MILFIFFKQTIDILPTMPTELANIAMQLVVSAETVKWTVDTLFIGASYIEALFSCGHMADNFLIA